MEVKLKIYPLFLVFCFYYTCEWVGKTLFLLCHVHVAGVSSSSSPLHCISRNSKLSANFSDIPNSIVKQNPLFFF